MDIIDKDSLLQAIQQIFNEHGCFDGVKELIESSPAHIREKDIDGTLLHKAIVDQYPDDIILFLIDYDMSATMEKDAEGNLPLHMALISKTSDHVMIQLSHKNPDMTQVQNKYGRLCLHRAAGNQASINVINTLLFHHPGSGLTQDDDGALALHYAAKVKAAIEVVNALLQDSPNAAKVKDKDGKLPIHYATEKRAAVDVVQVLLAAYPDGLIEGDKDVFLPIHHACAKSAAIEVVEELIKCSPSTMLIPEKHGKLPLHVAVWKSASADIVELLLSKAPESVKFRDVQGMLPIHLALSSNVPAEVIQLLIDAFPDSLLEADNSGKLPIHMAFISKYPADLLHTMIYSQAGMKGLVVADSQNKLPIHYAAENDCNVSVMNSLVISSRGSLMTQDNAGKLPLHYATKGSSSEDVIRLLLSSNLASLLHCDKEGKIPLHYAMLKTFSYELIEALLKSSPSSAGIKDRNGLSALHYAAKNAQLTEIIKVVHKYQEEASKERDNFGLLPLHYAIEKKLSDEVILLMLRNMSEDVLCIQNDPWPPLRHAVYYNASYEIVRAMLDIAPDLWDQRDKYKKNALHYAVMNGSAISIIEALLSSSSCLLTEKDKHGKLPLHYAVSKCSSDIIRALLACDPRCVVEKDKHGKIPLHYAARRSPLNIVQMLINSNPATILMKESKGRIPLHYALMREESSIEIVQAFVDSSLLCLIEPDDDGWHSLHFACRFPTSLDIIQLILQCCPNLVIERNRYDRVPLNYALANQARDDIILTILDAAPSVLYLKDKDGWLPIHYAANYIKSFTVIDALVSAYPGSSSELLLDDSSALHLSIASQSESAIILHLLASSPQMARVKGRGNSSPLLLALKNFASIDVIQALISAAPEMILEKNLIKEDPIGTSKKRQDKMVLKSLLDALPSIATMKSRDGNTILHLLLEYEFPSNDVLRFLSLNPSNAKVKNMASSHPIHIASRRNASIEVINQLIANAPDSLKDRDAEGCYPLSIAIVSLSSPECIQAIVQAWPEACKFHHKKFREDCNNEFPLHLCAQNNIHVNVLLDIVEMYPVALRAENKQGNPPIHLACMNSSSLDVINALLELAPDVCSILNNNGYNALHVAIMNRAPHQLIMRLLESDLDLCKATTKDNSIALHLAVSYNGRLETIMELLQAYPNSNLIQNKSKLTPFLMGLETKASVEILKYLVSLDMPIDFDGTPKEHAHSWTAFLDPSKASWNVQDTISFVREKFTEYEKHIPTLAYCKDALGRVTIDIADKRVKDVIYEKLFFCGRFKLREGHPLHVSATSIVLLADDYGVVEDYLDVFNQCCRSHRIEKLTYQGFQDAVSMLAKKWNKSLLLDQEAVRKDFELWDPNRDTVLSWEEFEKYCKAVYGETRLVALKLVSSEDQYKREKEIRLIDGKMKLEDDFIISLLREPDPDKLAQSIQQVICEDISLAGYQYCLVMPAADRSLDASVRYENLKIKTSLDYAEHVLDCLVYLHQHDIVHGDVKLMNAVRLDNRIRLIDLDAAMTMNDADDWNQYLGLKFSSGVLPPEMFVELDSIEKIQQYESYWQHLRLGDEIQKESWLKLMPYEVKDRRKAYAIRSYDVDKNGLVRDADKLPYELFVASHEHGEKLDAWSYGLLLYHMIADKPLFQVDKKDDFDRIYASSIFSILKASNGASKIGSRIDTAVLEKGVPRWYSVLLRGLLEIDPDKRFTLVQAKAFIERATQDENNPEILRRLDDLQRGQNEIRDIVLDTNELVKMIHTQTSLIEERTMEIENLTKKALDKIDDAQKVLLRGMIEATGVKVPTTFIILNRDLRVVQPINPSTKGRLSFSFPNVAVNMSGQEDNQEMIIDKAISWTNRIVKFTDTMSKIVTTASKVVADPKHALEEAAREFFLSDEKLYLYLVDEYTMQPAVNDDDPIYPIEITRPQDFIPKVLPLLQVGLKGLSLLNTASKLGHCFGFPTPVIPGEYLTQMDTALASLTQQSSVADYANLQIVVDDAVNDEKSAEGKVSSMTGAALREMEVFFAEYDKRGYFSDLRRVMTQEGKCCWTSAANADLLEARGEGEDNFEVVDGVVSPRTPRGSRYRKNSKIRERPSETDMSSVVDISSNDFGIESHATAYLSIDSGAYDDAPSNVISAAAIQNQSFYARDELIVPAAKYGYLTKKSSLPFFKDKKYYFILHDGSLVYYAKDHPDNPLIGLSKRGEVVDFKWKSIVVSGHLLMISRDNRNELTLYFERVKERDDWDIALKQHIEYVKMRESY
jgi:ankyrin repeat protein/serine/threonine protein kinase